MTALEAAGVVAFIALVVAAFIVVIGCGCASLPAPLVETPRAPFRSAIDCWPLLAAWSRNRAPTESGGPPACLIDLPCAPTPNVRARLVDWPAFDRGAIQCQ
jgi:hypothetical protein